MNSREEFAYQLRNIQYEYSGKIVLDIAELNIKRNKITCLVGGNGSGKTTLLNLLAFLEKEKSGKVIFLGQKSEKSTLLKLRRRVALVAQNSYLLRGTVLENIMLGLKLHGIEKEQQSYIAKQAMTLVGIEDFSDRNIKKISGGEAQKVALARALALQPEVLLLDEPFSYLDQKSIEELELLLEKITKEQGKTIILSTHDQLQGMVIADDMISLVAGKPVDSPLLNMFQGEIKGQDFHTDSLEIFVPEDVVSGKHLIIDPADIVLSKEALVSSIRNNFKGRVISISEDKGRVWMTIDAGEKFHVQITRESLTDMALNIGSEVWVNFKSTSVKVLS